jgi:hypothetical protein
VRRRSKDSGKSAREGELDFALRCQKSEDGNWRLDGREVNNGCSILCHWCGWNLGDGWDKVVESAGTIIKVAEGRVDVGYKTNISFDRGE